MRSSTSSSEALTQGIRPTAGRYSRAITILLALIIVFLAAIEWGSRIGLRHISRVEKRVAADYEEARSLRPGSGYNILLTGNSLLLEGLDYDQIRSTPKPFKVTRYAVENTTYYDWYFGIRRLLREGSRPNMIAMCFAPLDILSNRIRGEYVAYHLVSLSDIPDVARTQHFDLTQSSSFLLAHFSFFYAERNGIRNFVISSAFPAYAAMLQGIEKAPGHYPASSEIERVTAQRLTALEAECDKYGVALVVIVPPRGSTIGEAGVADGGRAAGVRVLIPIHGGVLSRSYFRDGFHLTAKGAAVFTDALSRSLAELPEVSKLADNRARLTAN